MVTDQMIGYYKLQGIKMKQARIQETIKAGKQKRKGNGNYTKNQW
jgi:hypothetical protein